MSDKTAPILAATDSAIEKAAKIIISGGLVAMPTETVYGLAANAHDAHAVTKIFEAKDRPTFNPLIAHVADVAQAAELGVMNEMAQTLATSFWPGPLTLILKRLDDCPVCPLACAGLPTIAVRVPSHPVAQDVIRLSGVAIAAPSANPSGKISATRPVVIAETMGDKLDMILADGACAIGLESTVVDVSGPHPVLARSGAITLEMLEEALGRPVIRGDEKTSDKPTSPGQTLRHYAPETPLRLKAVDVAPEEALLAFGSEKFMGLRGGGRSASLPPSQRRNLSESGDLNEAAANLYTYLQELDRPEHTAIAVMDIPETGLGRAINDRLRRAAGSQKL